MTALVSKTIKFTEKTELLKQNKPYTNELKNC